MQTSMLLTAILFILLSGTVSGQDDPVIHDYDKVKMDKAIELAKGSLDKFMVSLKAKKAKYYALKVAFPTDDGKDTEHCWVGYLEVKGEKVFGKMDSVPKGLSKIKEGDLIELDMKLVSDWMIVNGRSVYGGYTSRVLEEGFPENERITAQGMKWQAFDQVLP